LKAFGSALNAERPLAVFGGLTLQAQGVVPLMLTKKGERANVQNELLVSCQWSDVSCSLVYSCAKNAQSVQVCPMTGPTDRNVAPFLMSFWNKQIGSAFGVFGVQKA
jgi:hypothetical protein